jgi:hypothetical protein
MVSGKSLFKNPSGAKNEVNGNTIRPPASRLSIPTLVGLGQSISRRKRSLIDFGRTTRQNLLIRALPHRIATEVTRMVTTQFSSSRTAHERVNIGA